MATFISLVSEANLNWIQDILTIAKQGYSNIHNIQLTNFFYHIQFILLLPQRYINNYCFNVEIYILFGSYHVS